MSSLLPLAATPEPLFLVSWIKPILLLALFAGWGRVVSRLDEDAAYFFLKRRLWGAIHMGTGAFALLIALGIPLFWVSAPLALLIMAGEVGAYVLVRNKMVSEKDRWTFDPASFMKTYEKRREAAVQAKAPVKLIGKDDKPLDIPVGDHPQAHAFQFFTETLEFAVPRSAQKVEFTVAKESAGLKVWLDGVEYPQKAPEPKLALEVINFLKQQTGMDVNEVRRKQTGKLWVQVEGYGRHLLEMTSIGTTRSISLTFELDPDRRGEIPFDFMGFSAEQKAEMKTLVNGLNRVVLVSTPPQQGSSTLLYGMVRMHDAYTNTLMVYERAKQVDIDGAKHVQYPEGGNEQINSTFRALLRAEPNVLILPGGVLDPAMARAILEDAENIRFYVPIPAKDTFAAVQAWQAACGDPKRSAQALAGVVSARLVRRLCHTCRVPYQPDAEALRKMNLNPEKIGTLYKASGKVLARNAEEMCPDCLGVGYKGRVAAYEVMVLDDTARQMLADNRMDELRAHLRKHKMKTLQDSALHHVGEGITDVREVTRVLSAQVS